MIKCEICGRAFQNLAGLGRHIRRKHKISTQEYYDKYLLKDESEKKCLICGSPTRFNGLGGYSQYCSSVCVSRCEKCKEKSRQTNLQKRGVCYPTQSPDVRQKCIETCLKKWGVKNVYQSKEIQDRYKKTCQDRYGVDNPFSLLEIKEKITKTNIRKYGDRIAFRNKKVQDKSKQTCLKKWKVDNYSKTFEFRLFARNVLINRIKKLSNGCIHPMEGRGETPCFLEIEKHIPYSIRRGVSKIGYFPDGFIEEVLLVIEFDEPYHQTSNWAIKYDKRRDEDFRKIGWETFRIIQTDWNDPKKKIDIIRKLIGVIDDRIKSRSTIMF